MNKIILLRIFEIDLGNIKSFPKININTDSLRKLSNLSEYEYEVSLVGKRISDSDEEVRLNDYSKNFII